MKANQFLDLSRIWTLDHRNQLQSLCHKRLPINFHTITKLFLSSFECCQNRKFLNLEKISEMFFPPSDRFRCRQLDRQLSFKGSYSIIPNFLSNLNQFLQLSSTWFGRKTPGCQMSRNLEIFEPHSVALDCFALVFT